MSLDLSDDARCVMGGWFGMGLTEVSFGMKEVRPTARAQGAIDELVTKGLVWREPMEGGGFRLKPLTPGEPFGKWLSRNRGKGDWPLTASGKLRRY